MIICQCNVIACNEIRKAVGHIRAGDPFAVVTPTGVFRCCGKRPRCGSCMPLVTGIIQQELGAAPISDGPVG
jgi:bacterioferritin-associated ferredoxin